MTNTNPDPAGDEFELLVTERRIERVLVAYCQGVDRKDWAQVRGCYHDDALDSHGSFVGSPNELVTWLQSYHEDVTSSMHVLTNVSIRLSDDWRLARVESYCLSLKELSSAARDPVLAAQGTEGVVRRTVANRYVDTFEQRPSVGWRILNRQVVFEWVRRESDELYVPLDPAWVASQRTRGDVLYNPLSASEMDSAPSSSE